MALPLSSSYDSVAACPPSLAALAFKDLPPPQRHARRRRQEEGVVGQPPVQQEAPDNLAALPWLSNRVLMFNLPGLLPRDAASRAFGGGGGSGAVEGSGGDAAASSSSSLAAAAAAAAAAAVAAGGDGADADAEDFTGEALRRKAANMEEGCMGKVCVCVLVRTAVPRRPFFLERRQPLPPHCFLTTTPNAPQQQQHPNNQHTPFPRFFLFMQQKLNIRENGSVTLEIGGLPFSVALGVPRQQYQHVVATLPRRKLKAIGMAQRGGGGEGGEEGDDDDEEDEEEGEEEEEEEEAKQLQKRREEGYFMGEESEEDEEGQFLAGSSSSSAAGAPTSQRRRRAIVHLGALAHTLTVTPDLEALLSSADKSEKEGTGPLIGGGVTRASRLVQEYNNLGPGEGSALMAKLRKAARAKAVD
jgi:hypothetical protein